MGRRSSASEKRGWQVGPAQIYSTFVGELRSLGHDWMRCAQFGHLIGGFRNSDLRSHAAELLDIGATEFTFNHVTYDLRPPASKA